MAVPSGPHALSLKNFSVEIIEMTINISVVSISSISDRCRIDYVEYLLSPLVVLSECCSTVQVVRNIALKVHANCCMEIQMAFVNNFDSYPVVFKELCVVIRKEFVVVLTLGRFARAYGCPARRIGSGGYRNALPRQ